ncbi:MAG: hypothetical protein ACOX7K_04385 [Oscillospiraceae bacterium]|jgi:hypothetical protein
MTNSEKVGRAWLWTSLLFVICYIIVLIYGLYFLCSGDEMGYAFLYLILLPILASVNAFFLARQKGMGICCIVILLYAAANMLSPYVAFHTTGFLEAAFILVPGIVCMLIGKSSNPS